MAGPTVLTVDEAAKHLTVSPSYLNKARMRGEGPPFVRPAPRRIAYLLDDLESYLRSTRVAEPCQAIAA